MALSITNAGTGDCSTGATADVGARLSIPGLYPNRPPPASNFICTPQPLPHSIDVYMYRARWFLSLLATFGIAVGGHAAQTQAKLVLAAEAAAPGETVMAGVHLRMPRNWHTYWRYGGEAGDPTKIQWELPSGIAAGPIM